MYSDHIIIEPSPISALCWQIHRRLTVLVPLLRVWVHCPRASNGLLPRRSNLVGYVRWDAQSDRSSLYRQSIQQLYRSQPSWVLNDHTKDQFPNLLRCRSSSDRPPDSGDQPPVDSKTSPVPTDDGFRRDQDERMFPSRPNPPSDYPEELIEEVEARARMSTLQRDELLTQSEILKKETSPLTKEANQHSEAEPDEAKHGQGL